MGSAEYRDYSALAPLHVVQLSFVMSILLPNLGKSCGSKPRAEAAQVRQGAVPTVSLLGLLSRPIKAIYPFALEFCFPAVEFKKKSAF